MFKDTITYTDYNGNERKETFYFNLSKAEMIMLDNSVPGGWGRKIEQVVEKMDNVGILNYFTEIIEKSYGVKSDDGKRFVKNPELTEEFMQTEAFSEFMMKIISDPDYMMRFVTGIIPDTSGLPESEKIAIIEKAASEGKVVSIEDIK